MEEKEYTVKEALTYLGGAGRVITPRRLQAICKLSGTPKAIIEARHTNPANPPRGEWLIRQSELDKLIARGNKKGNPTGFNEEARSARWQRPEE